jgi:hypothetical protein
MAETVDYRKILCRGQSEDESPRRKDVAAEPPLPPPMEMMPCLGRHPQIRCDHESPTLMKVREVYKRRDEQDARWVEERREAITRRIELNAFKAREQQRELMLQDFQQKELHKVRMLQAEEKKSMLEAERNERAQLLNIQKIHRLLAANERAEDITEDKRNLVSANLDEWQAGVAKAIHHTHRQEIELRKEGERRNQEYMERIMAIGEIRQQGNSNPQAQRNDQLKKNIQNSLRSQLAEQHHQENLARAELTKAKQEAATVRRHNAMHGNRFGFAESAFGARASGFDAKYHMVAVDRRANPWQQNAKIWSQMRESFSMPQLPRSTSVAPGG